MSLADSLNPNVLFGRVLGPLLFRKARVAAVRDLGTHFRRLELEGADLRGTAATAGDKVQVFLGAGGMRTYSPIDWNGAAGTTSLVVFVHGDGPGAMFGRSASVGDEVQFFGPRRSIDLESQDAPVVFFGDESSVAVLCAATRRAGARVLPVLEVADADEVTKVLDALEVREALCVPKDSSDLHMPRVATAIRERLTNVPRARLAMTGRAQSIQALRSLLKVTGSLPPGKTKAYWSVGRKGLD